MVLGRFACLVLLVQLLFSPPAAAEGSFTAAEFRAIEKQISARLSTYMKCQAYPCPDADCAGWGAAYDALNRLAALTGTPLRTRTEESWNEIETRRQTLGYWIEQEDKARSKLYEDLLSQANRDREKAARIGVIAGAQQIFINISKGAQLVADVTQFAEFVSNPKALADATAGLREMAVATEILSLTGNIMETAEFARQAAEVSGLKEPGKGIPEAATAANNYVAVIKESYGFLGGSVDGLGSADRAIALYKEYLSLRASPVEAGSATRDAALAARRSRLSALLKEAETHAGRASEMAAKAAKAGLLAGVKVATLFAEEQQKELRDRLAEHLANATAEEKALVAQVGDNAASGDRRAAMVAMKAKADQALSLLGGCLRACPGHALAGPPDVPTGDFLMPPEAGENAGKESYGKALAWYRGIFDGLAADYAATAEFRVEDGKITLTGKPATVRTGQPIVIGYEGAQCLIRRGRIEGDGEERKTSPDAADVTFSAKDKPGQFTYTYSLEDLWQEEGSDRYEAATVINVVRPGLLGYWRRNSPVKIINGLGETVDWPKGPQNLVIAQSDGGTAHLAYLDYGPGIDLVSRFTSANAGRCTLEDGKLTCKFRHDTDCGGQWYDVEVRKEGESDAHLKVTGGEFTHQTDTGCTVFPHPFSPWDFSMARASEDDDFRKAFPCPPGYRCE